MRCGNEATLLLTPSKTQQNKRGHCSAIPPVGAGLPIPSPPHEPKNQRDGDEIPRGNHHADTGGTPTHLLHGLHAIAVEQDRAMLLCDRHGATDPRARPARTANLLVSLVCKRSDATSPPDCKIQTGPERKSPAALAHLRFVPSSLLARRFPLFSIRTRSRGTHIKELYHFSPGRNNALQLPGDVKNEYAVPRVHSFFHPHFTLEDEAPQEGQDAAGEGAHLIHGP